MISTKPKKVSVYIPCRNAENHLGQTLKSIFAQTYPISEVIAVDDGSTDKTVEVVQQSPIILIRQPNPMGITVTRNAAIEKATGDVVASIDADVILEKRWLEGVMTHFADPHVGGVGGRIIEGNTDPLVGQWLLAHRNPDRGEKRIENAPCLPGGAVAYQRRVLLEVGGYNDDRRYDHSDLDLSLRVKMIGYRLVYEPEAICHHHFQGQVRDLFDGGWRFKKDAYVNCGLFTNLSGLQRKIEINLGEHYQMLMDDFNSGRPGLMYLSVVGALRYSLMDFGLYCHLHPENGEKSDGDTFGALKLGLQYLFEQKREISEPVMADILSHVLDISLDSERGIEAPGVSDRVGDRDIVLTLQERFPRANLDRVSDGLTLFLGFLNTLPREAWETMNRSH